MPRRFFLAAALVIGLPALVQAQYGNRGQGGRMPMGAQPVEIHGSLQGIARGNLMVLDPANNQAWRIALLPATKVHVTGTGAVNNLRSGLIVEFVAQLDDRGAIQQKVGTLTIASRDRLMGFFPSDAAPPGDGQGGIGADAGVDAGADRDKPAARAPGKAGPQPAGTYRVVGQLVVGRGGTLAVKPGRVLLPFELSDQPTIKIDSADLTIVSRGTDISVRGMVMPGRPGQAQAYEVTVKLPEPPAGAKDEPAAKPDAKHPPQHPKTGDGSGLPEPAAEK